MVRISKIKGIRTKLTIIGNTIHPSIKSWIHGYRHKPSPLHNGKPIPDNVIYLDHYREIVVNQYATSGY